MSYANDCSSSHMYHNAPGASQRPLHLLLQQKLLKTRADIYATALVIALVIDHVHFSVILSYSEQVLNQRIIYNISYYLNLLLEM